MVLNPSASASAVNRLRITEAFVHAR
jgi:hypothetical protein